MFGDTTYPRYCIFKQKQRASIITRQLVNLVWGIGMLAGVCKGQEVGLSSIFSSVPVRGGKLILFRSFAAKISTSLPEQPDR